MTRRAFPASLKTVKVAATLLSITLVVVILYWGKVVLIPVALAVMLTFILSPLVTRLDRWGLWRVPAVLVVVATTGLLLLGMIWLVGSQLHSLANDLPNYRENIREKVAALRGGGTGGPLANIRSTLQDATRQPEASKLRDPKAGKEQPATVPEPIPVRVVPEEGPDQALSAVLASVLALSPALEALATGGLALVLVIFMLIKREDLRNRLVSLTAQGNLTTTTKALDDAGQRISRYLLIQLIINGTFGAAVAVGLLVIGVPYALLWGLCAAVFRYIPYIGPWVAALLPLAVSLVTSPTWSQVLLVLGLFLVLELVSNNVMEPWLYGQGVGLSGVALLVSAAFWTWIWGPVGLILATPLTVCLVVIGKYVPALDFLDRLLGDRPALRVHAAFLQRLLARDTREAAEIVRSYRTDHAPEMVYDEVLVPALALARRDRSRGNMGANEESFVLEATKGILAELSPNGLPPAGPPSATKRGQAADPGPTAEPADASARLNSAGVIPEANSAVTDTDEGFGRPGGSTAATEQNGRCSNPPPSPAIRILGYAAHQGAEELTLHMLDHLVRPAGLQIEVLSTRTLPSEVADRVIRDRASVVVIAALPPGGLVQARFICKLLRKRFPELGIVVGCWGYRGNLDRIIVSLRSAGAHYVTTTMLGARSHVVSLAGTPALPSGDSPQPEPKTVSGV
jgi:predicted PurR-regulated permease PerM